MLCEKCGKKNRADAVKCSECGASMPGKSGCGGFGDILSYEKTITPSGSTSIPSGVDSAEVAKLSKHIKVLEKNNKKLGTISLISLALGVIAVLISVFVMMSSKKDEIVSEKYDAGYASQTDVEDMLSVYKIAEKAAESESNFGLNPNPAQID